VLSSDSNTTVRNPEKQPRKQVQSVRRAAKLLRAFTIARPELGLSELSRLTGLHKTSAYRLLSTLEEEGFVRQNPENEKYSLGPVFFRFGAIVSDSDLTKHALPHMRALVEQTGETAALHIWDEGRTLAVAIVDGTRPMAVSSRVGAQLPPCSTASGKALLAFLPPEEAERVIAQGLKRFTDNTITDPARFREELENIRTTGLSFDREETDTGFSGVSSPIFDHFGNLAGVVTIVTVAGRLRTEEGQLLPPLVKKTAELISRELGFGFGEPFLTNR
jgi:IclR family transcriptional regulator, KDG regulon repressor